MPISISKLSATRTGNILRELQNQNRVASGTSAATGKAKVWWLLDDLEVEGVQHGLDDEAPPIEDEDGGY